MDKFFRKTIKIWRGLILVFALFLALFVVLSDMGERYEGFINDALGTQAPTATGKGETNYFPSKYGELNAENCAKLIADENAFNIQAMKEGAVMLRNRDNALPLAADERSITLFGAHVAEGSDVAKKGPVYATNAGGSGFKAARGGSLYSAFERAGFEINDTLYNAYKNSPTVRVSTSTAGDIGEESISFYTPALQSSYADKYNDAAIVLLTRYGGEGVDLKTTDADGVPQLSFHKDEADLLKMIKASGKFGKTVVLVNSPFPMDLEWIEDYETYGVDACLAFGAAGDTGFIGIAELLTGEADPSGHLADTYATSSLSSPAMRNFGSFTFANHNVPYENVYTVYAEGIYVGYKYYETRYQDQVLGKNNAASSKGAYASSGDWDYAEEMAYTFGHGLSYARFEQNVKSIIWDTQKHEVTAEIEVTNLGAPQGSNYTGKSQSVVQLYAQAPYEAGQAEKSAVQLIGFAKTEELGKGETVTVPIKVDDYLFASYDATAVNGADTTKQGCYVFDAGDYYFAIGDNAHDALNNILAVTAPEAQLFDETGATVTGDAEKVVKHNLAELDNKTHAASKSTGEPVCNHLQEIDYNYYRTDKSVTYLTRADWNTFPDEYRGLTVNDALKTDLQGKSYRKDPSVTVGSVKTGVDSDIKFVDMRDVAYDDPKWDTFLDQLSVNDLAMICGETMGNKVVQTVGKPPNNNTDGPKGIGSTYVKGNGTGITLYVDEVVMASTFNLELSTQRGELFAEDGLYSGYSMVFGPGADWHRTPYAGRNSEYYSEDPNMSFLCGAAQCKAMQKGGLIPAIKHFVGNDQETNRHGVATFASEQGFREGSLRCFEGALRDDKGGALGTMTCFNRVGATAGAASRAVLIDILRNEWGFKGVNLTDSSKDASDYVHTEECVFNGTDMFNNDASRADEILKLIKQGKDGQILRSVREINKHYYYAYSRSNLINGLTHDSVVSEFVPWWQTALSAGTIVFAVLTGLMAAMFVASEVFKGLSEAKAAKAGNDSAEGDAENKEVGDE